MGACLDLGQPARRVHRRLPQQSSAVILWKPLERSQVVASRSEKLADQLGLERPIRVLHRLLTWLLAHGGPHGNGWRRTTTDACKSDSWQIGRFEPEKSGESLLTDGIPVLMPLAFCNCLAQK
jgi:hypothetical protein